MLAKNVHLQHPLSGNSPAFITPAFTGANPVWTGEPGATPMEDNTNPRGGAGAWPELLLTGVSGRSTGNPMAKTGQPRATTLARIAAANAASYSEMDLVSWGRGGWGRASGGASPGGRVGGPCL